MQSTSASFVTVSHRARNAHTVVARHTARIPCRARTYIPTTGAGYTATIRAEEIPFRVRVAETCASAFIFRRCGRTPVIWIRERGRSGAKAIYGHLRRPRALACPCLGARFFFFFPREHPRANTVWAPHPKQEPARTSPSCRAERLKAKRLAGRPDGPAPPRQYSSAGGPHDSTWPRDAARAVSQRFFFFFSRPHSEGKRPDISSQRNKR